MATDAYGAAADHAGLSGLTVGDPHLQYTRTMWGLASARPAQPIREGTRYLATDTQDETISTGSAWISAAVVVHTHDYAATGHTHTQYADISVTSAWTQYTATVGGWSGGSLSVSSRYRLIGKTCIFAFQLNFSSAPTQSAGLTLSVPFAALSGSPSQTWAALKVYHPAAGGEVSGTLAYLGSAASQLTFRAPTSTGTHVVTALGTAAPYGVAISGPFDMFGTIVYETA